MADTPHKKTQINKRKEDLTRSYTVGGSQRSGVRANDNIYAYVWETWPMDSCGGRWWTSRRRAGVIEVRTLARSACQLSPGSQLLSPRNSKQGSCCASSQEEEFFVWLWGEGSRILQGRVFDVFLGILPSLPWHFLLREKGNVELGGYTEGSERGWGRENMIKIYCLKGI